VDVVPARATAVGVFPQFPAMHFPRGGIGHQEPVVLRNGAEAVRQRGAAQLHEELAGRRLQRREMRRVEPAVALADQAHRHPDQQQAAHDAAEPIQPGHGETEDEHRRDAKGEDESAVERPGLPGFDRGRQGRHEPTDQRPDERCPQPAASCQHAGDGSRERAPRRPCQEPDAATHESIVQRRRAHLVDGVPHRPAQHAADRPAQRPCQSADPSQSSPHGVLRPCGGRLVRHGDLSGERLSHSTLTALRGFRQGRRTLACGGSTPLWVVRISQEQERVAPFRLTRSPR
jgi:hypothetical protein